MFIDVFGSNLSGILPLQHQLYDRPEGGQPGWDLDLRAHKRCVRITGRWDTAGGIGQWKIDRDSVGDLCGGFCWLSADKNKRAVAYWSFAIPAVISRKGGGTPTQGAAGGGPSSSGQMYMNAQGDQEGNPDGRLVPIPVKAKVMVGEGPKPPIAAGGGKKQGDVLYMGMGTKWLQWTKQPLKKGEPFIGMGAGGSYIGWEQKPFSPDEPRVEVGAGSKPIQWQKPKIDPAANPNPRLANPAIKALRPKGK